MLQLPVLYCNLFGSFHKLSQARGPLSASAVLGGLEYPWMMSLTVCSDVRP